MTHSGSLVDQAVSPPHPLHELTLVTALAPTVPANLLPCTPLISHPIADKSEATTGSCWGV